MRFYLLRRWITRPRLVCENFSSAHEVDLHLFVGAVLTNRWCSQINCDTDWFVSCNAQIG